MSTKSSGRRPLAKQKNLAVSRAVTDRCFFKRTTLQFSWGQSKKFDDCRLKQ